MHIAHHSVDLPVAVMRLVEKITKISGVERVYLFGSRARGDAKERSDYDLAIDAPQISGKNWHVILSMGEEADTLFKIDLVHLQGIGDSFKEQILREGLIIS